MTRGSNKHDRAHRVAEQIRRDLAEIVQREVPTARVGLVTLSDVEISPDYAHARVFFTCIGAEPAAVAQVLNDKAGYFHSLLYKRLTIHTVPRLRFVYDESVERGFEIDRLIDDAVGNGSKTKG